MAIKTKKDEIEKENIEENENSFLEKTVTSNNTRKNWIYIGSDVGSVLRNSLFIGTKEEVLSYFEDYVKKIPEVEECLIPVEKLGELDDSPLIEEYRKRILEKLEKETGGSK